MAKFKKCFLCSAFENCVGKSSFCEKILPHFRKSVKYMPPCRKGGEKEREKRGRGKNGWHSRDRFSDEGKKTVDKGG